jgi:hypothetical protein
MIDMFDANELRRGVSPDEDRAELNAYAPSRRHCHRVFPARSRDLWTQRGSDGGLGLDQMDNISRSEVSWICALLEEELAEFRERPLDEPYALSPRFMAALGG